MSGSSSRNRGRSLLTATAVGVLVGIGYPLLALWRNCRRPASEGCVWGKAYLPLSLGIGVVVALVVAAVAYALLQAWATRRGPDAPGG